MNRHHAIVQAYAIHIKTLTGEDRMPAIRRNVREAFIFCKFQRLYLQWDHTNV